MAGEKMQNENKKSLNTREVTWQKILEEKQLAKMLRWLQIKQQKKRVLQRRKILHL